MDITFVTTNDGKAESLRRIFTPKGVSVNQVSLELPEPQLTSLQEIAEHKARYAYEKIGEPVVVQDAGFILKAWNGFPGPFVKFALQTLNIPGLLALVEGRDRGCSFRECLAYYDGTTMKFFEAIVPGSMSREPRGGWVHDSPTRLWSVFIPEDHYKTIAEMTPGERSEWRETRTKNYGDLFADWFFGPRGPGHKK